MEIDISRIRELLTLMPSDSLFRQIYAILLKGTDADPMYDIAMEYILEHIESWPVGFRQTTLPTGLPVFDTFIAPRGTTELPPYAPHWKGLVTYTSDMATLRSKGWEQIRYLEVICDVPDAVVGLEMCENLEYLRISPLAGTIQGYPTLRPPDNVKVFDTIRHNFELPIKHIPLSTQHLIVRGAAATTEDVGALWQLPRLKGIHCARGSVAHLLVRHAHYEYITLGLEDEASRDYVSDRLPAWINKGLRRPAVKILVLYDWALRFLNSSVLEGLRVLCPNADIQLLTNVSPSRRPVDQEVTLPGLWDWGTTHAHMINLAFSDIKENACHTADTA